MDYEEPVPIIVRTSWWSKKRVIIMLVTFLLVLLGGIAYAIIFSTNLVLKSGVNNPLADSALTSTSTTTTTTTTSSSTSSSTAAKFFSCLDVYNHNVTRQNGIYSLETGSAYCDMLNGGWTLLAKFTDSGDWVFSSSTVTGLIIWLLILHSTDPSTISSGKSHLWSMLNVSFIRIDTANNSSQTVTLKNPLWQTMYELMQMGVNSLVTVNGSIHNFPVRHPNFQGEGQVKTTNNQVVIDFIANSSTFGFSIWPGCDTCTNRVRLGTLFAGGLDFNGGQESIGLK